METKLPPSAKLFLNTSSITRTICLLLQVKLKQYDCLFFNKNCLKYVTFQETMCPRCHKVDLKTKTGEIYGEKILM